MQKKKNIAEVNYDVVFTTELATIGLQFDGSKLIRLAYLTEKQKKRPKSKQAEEVKNRILDYLNPKSELKYLDVDISLNVTPFQQSVLEQLQLIPYGETRTYGDIAKALNTSPRAVGNACRHNPIAIIIPCHRVVAASHIGGYDGATSGSLLTIKSELLKMEDGYCSL